MDRASGAVDPDSACDTGCGRSAPAISRLCPSCRERAIVDLYCVEDQVRALRAVIDSGGVKAVTYRSDLETRRGTGTGVPDVIPVDAVSLLDELADVLAGLVRLACADNATLTPPRGRLRSVPDWRWRQHDDPGHGPVDPDQRSSGRYAVEPRLISWAPPDAAVWLRDRIPLWEVVYGCGGPVGRLRDVMARAFTVAPYGAPGARRIPVVPCPWCRQCSLAQYPHDFGVICTSCERAMSAAEYRAWAHVLAGDGLIPVSAVPTAPSIPTTR